MCTCKLLNTSPQPTCKSLNNVVSVGKNVKTRLFYSSLDYQVVDQLVGRVEVPGQTQTTKDRDKVIKQASPRWPAKKKGRTQVAQLTSSYIRSYGQH